MISPVESFESKCGAKEKRDCPETKFTSFLRDQSLRPQKETKNYVYKIFMSTSQEGGNIKINFVSDSRILPSDVAVFKMLPAWKLLTRTVFMADVV